MVRSALAPAAIAACLALAACGGEAQESSATPQPATGETSGEQASAIILSIDELDAVGWNLATIGTRQESDRYLSSKGSQTITQDLWLIDRASGETTSLLPGRPGEIKRSYFLSGEAGSIDSFSPYKGNDTQAEEEPLKYYLIMVDEAEKQTSLYAGSVEEKVTVKLAGPFDTILHMDVLEEEQLAIYVRGDNAVEQHLFDLATMGLLETTLVAPAQETSAEGDEET